eukprot:UN09663
MLPMALENTDQNGTADSSVVMAGRAYEVIMAIGTGIIHLMFHKSGLIWILTLCIGWIGYIFYRVYSCADKSQRT